MESKLPSTKEVAQELAKMAYMISSPNTDLQEVGIAYFIGFASETANTVQWWAWSGKEEALEHVAPGLLGSVADRHL